MAENRRMFIGAVMALAFALAASGVSPLAFVVSSAGIMSLHYLAEVAILPAIAVWLLAWAVSGIAGWSEMTGAFRVAAVAGVLGTIALEVVRVIGFREFGAMPGSMPELLGVQITNTFMQGPSVYSDLVGWGDHILVNGAGFAFIYVAFLGRQRWFIGILYALVIATIFMLSPATTATGAGIFGQDFAPVGFPLTVYIAHIAFGSAVGIVTARAHWTPNRSLFLAALSAVIGSLVTSRSDRAAAQHRAR